MAPLDCKVLVNITDPNNCLVVLYRMFKQALTGIDLTYVSAYCDSSDKRRINMTRTDFMGWKDPKLWPNRRIAD